MRPEPAEVNTWLEWAGGKLLSLGTQSPGPKSYRVAWPDFPDDVNTAFGYTDPKLRVPKPSKDEIPIMDEILLLPLVVGNVTTRRIIHARLLVTPLGGRHLYPWTRLAKLLHTDRRTVAHRHAQGLVEISEHAEPTKICLIFSFFASTSSTS